MSIGVAQSWTQLKQLRTHACRQTQTEQSVEEEKKGEKKRERRRSRKIGRGCGYKGGEGGGREEGEEGIGRGRGAKGMGELENENIPENIICNCVTPCTKSHIQKMEYLYSIQNLKFQNQILCTILSFR